MISSDLKTITLHNGREFKMGRTPPEYRARVYLSAFLRPGLVELPTPPPSADYSAPARAVLSNILLNNQLGCCVVSGGYHILGTWTANAGDPFTPTSQQVIADYSAIGGYQPGFPWTDRGCDEQKALDYWTKKGFADGSRIAGYIGVDAARPDEIRLAIYLFENLFFGVPMPDHWVGQGMPQADGFTWDVAGLPNPQNGHCFIATGYDAEGNPLIDTWGLSGTLTLAAAARYAAASSQGECYALISEAMVSRATQKAPNGLNWWALCNYLNGMGGSVPLPVEPHPVPVPVPPPTPMPPPPLPIPTPTPAPGQGGGGLISYDDDTRAISVPPNWTTITTGGDRIVIHRTLKTVEVPSEVTILG